jgi:hypothetical protein
MSSIDISREHNLSPGERDAALKDLSAYLRELGASVRQTDGELQFTGRGFEGEVKIQPGRAEGHIKLGLLARPFKRQLESEINRHLDARLGAK